MRSNYKKLGNYIRQVSARNKDLAIDSPMGININKLFMPSVANTVGTDLSKYRVVSKNQFAYNPMHVGRDEALPIAFLQSDKSIIVSPAYVIFEVVDPQELDPEYLMMWCRRPEFDRNAWFTTDNTVRGGFSWGSMCDMKLPIPSIEKQRETVKEYNAVVNRINLNEQLNKKLEETAQALYKYWFVDFEFPNEEGRPYKASGGEMVYNEGLDKNIPVSWKDISLGEMINYKKGNPFKSKEYTISGIPVIRVSDLTQRSIDLSECLYISESNSSDYKAFKLDEDDIIITSVGSWPQNPASVVGKVIKVPKMKKMGLLNQNMVRLRAIDPELQLFLFTCLARKEFSEFVISGAQGSANQASVTLTHLFSYKLCISNDSILNSLVLPLKAIYEYAKASEFQNNELKGFLKILLSKMATVKLEPTLVNI